MNLEEYLSMLQKMAEKERRRKSGDDDPARSDSNNGFH